MKKLESDSLLPLLNPPFQSAITYNMLVDLLQPFETLHHAQPFRTDGAFDRIVHESEDAVPPETAKGAVESAAERTVVLCRRAGYKRLATRNPESLILLIDVEFPDDMRFTDNTLAVKSPKPLTYFYLLIRDRMIRIAYWKRSLEILHRADAVLTDFIEASKDIIPNYLFVIDKNNYLRARSMTLEPPNEFFQTTTLSGFMSTEGDLRKNEPDIDSHGFNVGKGAAKRPAGRGAAPLEITDERVVYALHHENSVVGYLIMACEPSPVTDGLLDLLEIFLGYLDGACAKLWKTGENINIPRLRFFDMLLKGEQFDRIVIKKQLGNLGIPASSYFKLYLVDINESDEPAKASHIAMSFIADKHMDSRCFLFNDRLLILQYAQQPSDLSHLYSDKLLSSFEFNRFDVAFGISDVFPDINHLQYAYHEAIIALDLRSMIQAQRGIDALHERRSSLFYFYEAFPFYLVDPAPKDDGLRQFIFTTSILPAMIEEDIQRETNDFKLLWIYLMLERNATKTASAMYMHRNTVLYRIDRIQKRFKIDLDDSALREKLRCDYRNHFLMTQSGSSD